MEYFQYRMAKILGAVDRHKMQAIEFGPLNNPTLSKNLFDVVYVDYASTSVLREKKYDQTINPEDIVEVDYVWGGKPLSEIIHQKFDYAVACHVLEHVPDFIGWMFDVHSILNPSAILGLVLPDCRFTFDCCRQLTTLGELLESYLYRRTTPSVQQIFNHCFDAVVVDKKDAWAKKLYKDDLEKLNGTIALQFAYDQCLDYIKTNRYIDSHCWVFTPFSLLEIAKALAQLRLFPFSIQEFCPTIVGEFEFIIRLSKSDPATDKDLILNSIDKALLTLDNGESQAICNSGASR